MTLTDCVAWTNPTISDEDLWAIYGIRVTPRIPDAETSD